MSQNITTVVEKPAAEGQQENFFSLQDLWRLIYFKWYVIAISVVLALGVAVLYILKTPPVYKRTASVMIKADDKGKSLSNDMSAAFSELGLFQSNTNVNNELLSMKSPMLMEEVVRRLELWTSYEAPGAFHDHLLYGTNLPVTLHFPDLSEQESAECILSQLPSGELQLHDFVLNGEKTEDQDPVTLVLGKATETPLGKVLVNKNQGDDLDLVNGLIIKRSSLYDAVENLGKNLTVNLADEKSTILSLSLLDRSQERADAILNTLVATYNESWLADRNLSAVSASLFIDERLGLIEKDLGEVDKNITKYKSQHLLPDVQTASNLFLNQAAQVDNQIVELRSREYMARQVRNLLKNLDKSRLLPVNSFVNNPSLEQQIGEFNDLLLKRNNLVKNSSESNPLVVDLDANLNDLKSVIVASLDNQLLAIETQLMSLRSSERKNAGRIAASPEQANYLISEGRQQTVKEALYLFLLQKREENQLSLAFTANNTRLISAPTGSPLPAFPQKRNILLAALVLGIIIPVAFLYLKETLDTSIRSRRDLDNMQIPFIGEIPSFVRIKRGYRAQIKKLLGIGKPPKKEIRLVVEHNNRNVINEAFRLVRTNIEMMLGRKNEQGRVLSLTSINPNSGKTFVALNLAASLAANGRRVLLIDLDMRVATLSDFVGRAPWGMSSLLTEATDDYRELIISTQVAGLDALPVGIIPPNPTELLSQPKLGELLVQFRKEYDYIVIDCPPVDLVADAALINEHTDLTIFIARAGMLDKRVLPVIDSYYKERKLRNMVLLLNGTDITASYGYGYGYGYGYVYGYGYGHQE